MPKSGLNGTVSDANDISGRWLGLGGSAGNFSDVYDNRHRPKAPAGWGWKIVLIRCKIIIINCFDSLAAITEPSENRS
jgi:hypothetical protein